jgi:DNA-directed RNA polymerase subunit alpha
VGFLPEFAGNVFQFDLESWYTPPQSAREIALRSESLQPLSIRKHKGREPAMTRIPLNRAYEQSQDIKDKLEMSTAEIGLAVRTTNCLEERGVFTVNDLLHCTREDLLSISNFGEKTLEEVYKALENVGFYRNSRETARI